MITKELLDFIKTQKSNGISEESITQQLISGGWDHGDVQQAFSQLNSLTTTVAPIPNMTPVQNVQSTQQSMNTMVSPVGKSGKKSIFIALVAIIAVLVLGGGGYAWYSGYFVSLEQVSAQAFQSMWESDSVSFDITTTADFSKLDEGTFDIGSITGNSSDSKKLSVTARGSQDKSDSENVKFDTTIEASIGSFTAQIELRALESVLYGKILKLPTIAFLPIGSNVIDKWVSFPFKKSDNAVIPMSIPGINLSIMEELIDDQKKDLFEITNNARFITITKTLTPETITDGMAYHFNFTLNEEGLKKYGQDIEKYIQSLGKDNSKLTAFTAPSFLEDFEVPTDFYGEAWIGKKDKRLQKFVIRFTVVPESDKPENSVELSIVGIFKNWGEPVELTKPEGSIPFEEFQMLLLGGALEDARTKAQGARMESIISSARPAAELYFSENNNSYLGFCNSFKRAHREYFFDCRDSAKAYAIVSLEPGTRFCADATGFAGPITTELLSTSCKK